MRKGENIHKRKDGRWEARYFDERKGTYVSVYGHTYGEAKEKRNTQLINEQKKTITKNRNKDIDTCCNIWLQSKQNLIKQSTYCKYYDIINNHIIPILGKSKISKLKQESIDSFINTKLKNGLSPKTVKDIIAVLKQVLKSNQIEFNFIIPSSPKKEVTIFQEKEYRKFTSYLLLSTDTEKLGILLSLSCGLRIGELCALKWDDIDLSEGIIKINKTLQRVKNLNGSISTKTIIIIDKPKSAKSIREIPIPSFLLDILITLKKSNDCYILTGTRKYIEPRTQDRRFKKILHICGIDSKKYHTIRHTFASKCIENKADAKTLSEILGHCDVRFTMSQYVHSNMDLKRQELDKLSFTL